MATMNISLPGPMKIWVEAQTGDGRYSNVSDFVRDLIRREQERRDKIAHMQRLVDQSLASGISNETMGIFAPVPGDGPVSPIEMPAYRLTSAASDDVDQIYFDGVHLFGETQADRYHEGLEAAFRLIGDYPRAVRQRDEIDPPIRAYRYQAHIIIYKLDEDDTVIILGVRHSHEDWINRPV